MLNDQAFDTLAHNIKQLRKQHNYSKTKMAKLLKISVASINKIESGIIPHGMGVDVVFRIRDIFGMPFKDQFETWL